MSRKLNSYADEFCLQVLFFLSVSAAATLYGITANVFWFLTEAIIIFLIVVRNANSIVSSKQRSSPVKSPTKK
jgi:hypothetical protein